jgi:hypothetical protein
LYNHIPLLYKKPIAANHEATIKGNPAAEDIDAADNRYATGLYCQPSVDDCHATRHDRPARHIDTASVNGQSSIVDRDATAFNCQTAIVDGKTTSCHSDSAVYYGDAIVNGCTAHGVHGAVLRHCECAHTICITNTDWIRDSHWHAPGVCGAVAVTRSVLENDPYTFHQILPGACDVIVVAPNICRSIASPSAASSLLFALAPSERVSA